MGSVYHLYMEYHVGLFCHTSNTLSYLPSPLPLSLFGTSFYLLSPPHLITPPILHGFSITTPPHTHIHTHIHSHASSPTHTSSSPPHTHAHRPTPSLPLSLPSHTHTPPPTLPLPLPLPPTRVQYSLTAVVRHLGSSAQAGHYTAMCKDLKGSVIISYHIISYHIISCYCIPLQLPLFLSC